jgi:hypothetical protein
MFRITEDPSSESSVQCLAKNYKNGSIVSVDMDMVGVLLACSEPLCVYVVHCTGRHCLKTLTGFWFSMWTWVQQHWYIAVKCECLSECVCVCVCVHECECANMSACVCECVWVRMRVRVSVISDSNALLCANLQYDSVSVFMQIVSYFKSVMCYCMCQAAVERWKHWPCVTLRWVT